jgi:hypothetical protein
MIWVIAAIAVAGAAITIAALFFYKPAVLKEAPVVGWKADFDKVISKGQNTIPEGWRIANKPGTKPVVFSVKRDAKNNIIFLNMKADMASSSLLTSLDTIDLTKTPTLRWSWRVITLPKGADGRIRSRDDQAIGLYIGTGSQLNNKSISYRWDTETPTGAEGDIAYGLGGVKVKWHTLRNKKDAANGNWYVEERNVAEDFKEAWGFYPEKLYLGVSCNSQYTRSEAEADLGLLEFIAPPASKKRI